MPKPFSQACENNKQPILSVLQTYFNSDDLVLEIASGTTQHVQFFAENLPEVVWQPSDIEASFETVVAGLAGNQLNNILPPIVLDVQQDPWPLKKVDGVFTANSLHIMSLSAVECFFTGVGLALNKGGFLCVYGPFKYEGEFTSESNAKFDLWLKGRDQRSGVRDFEAVNQLARQAGLELVTDELMPANNQLLVWER